MGVPLLDELLLDNPILVKHVRSRLRKTTLVPALIVTTVLMTLIGWWGYATGGFGQPMVYMWTAGLQVILIVIIGASQVAGSVGGVRESNILDFHRISPLPPLAVTLGFFLGAPILEYILLASTLPLALYCVAQGFPTFGGFVQNTALMIMVAWVFHGLALLSSLMAKKPKANAGGIVVFLFILLFNLWGALRSRFLPGDEDGALPFFGVPIPWLPFLALYLLPALTFLLIASTRKMRSERAHALSKPQAVAFLGAVTLLLLGGFWGHHDLDAPLALIVLYGTVAAALVATVTITPTANDYAKGLRRAERQGHRHLPPWDDLALNRVALGVLCLIVLVGSTLAWNAIAGRPEGAGPEGRISLSIAVGVLVVAYFGLAFQFFALVVPKRPGTMMTLFIFLAWVVPLLAGSIARAAGMSDGMAIALLSLSPPAGLATSAGAVPPGQGDVAQIAALMPAIVFAFLFNNLVTVYRRRVEREVGQVTPPKVEAVADPLAVG